MMRFPTSKEISRVRSMYPAGTIVRLISISDPYTNLKCGARGTVIFVDDEGQIHVDWENGSTLALIPGIDRFRKEM